MPTMSRMQQPKALRNRQHFSRKKKLNKRDEDPAAITPSSHSPHAGLSPWQVRLSPEPATPSCFHCCRSASVGKPLKTASSGVHIIPNPQLKRVPKRVTQKSAKGRERRRVQRRRSLVATVPVHRPTTVETHVWIPDQGGRHDSSAEYPGKYTHCTSFRLGNQPKALVSSMRSGDILPRAEEWVGLE